MTMKGGSLVCLLLTSSLLTQHRAPAQTFARVFDPALSATAKATACAWGDFNNDGHLDLFLANSTDASSYIFVSRGNGSFALSSLPDPWAQGGAWGDFNNDGHLDLARTISGIGGGLVIHSNNGNGTFTANRVGGLRFAPVWVDYDLDGNLDLAVVEHSYDIEEGVYIFRREPDGRFHRLPTQYSDSTSWATSPVWGNISPDLLPDLFVCNTDAANQLYINPGAGSSLTTMPDGSGSRAAAWGDYDNDGDLDLLVANYGANALYRNDQGTLQQVHDPALAAHTAAFTSCAWGDFDNDGYLDAFVTSFGEGNILFRNNGSGGFEKFEDSALAQVAQSTACAWGDYDNDGDLDIFVANTTNHAPRSGVASFLFRNETDARSWLKVKLEGRASNRTGIGAKVRALASIGGELRWQMREISGGNGRNQDAPIAHFGLGDATIVLRIQIEWPSGAVQVMDNNSVNQSLTVIENRALRIVSRPASTNVFPGETAGFKVVATGSGTLSYQWLLNGAAIANATNTTLTISNVQRSDLGNYAVRVQDGQAPPLGYPVAVTSLPATLDFWPTPEVSDPTSTAIFEGAPWVIWSMASGRGTVRLQWYKDGRELPAVTDYSISFPSARPEHSGNYFVVASNESGGTTSAVAVVRVDSNFVQTLLPIHLGWGPKKCGWIDYNNDGWQDLYLSLDSLSLFPNNGRGEFTNHLSQWVIGFSMASWADYNHDGLLDALAVCSQQNYILRQEPNGDFTQVLQREPVDDTRYDGAWADYDRDGDLDVLALGWDSVFLGRNDGNDIITPVNALPSSGYYSGTWGDYNNDGFPDLFMTHWYGEDTLYRNNRDGTFTALSGPPSTSPKTYSTGGSWADYDNDGDLDLFVGSRFGNSLYENLGDGSFRSADAGAIVTDPQETRGATWTDYDSDGWLDLYVANGEGDHLYRNNANGTFTAEPLGQLGDYLAPSAGAAWGDASGDGRPDLFVCLDGGWVNEHFIYVNNIKTNNWLTIQCVGRASNSSAIGAKVRVKATIRGRTVWQLREITAGNAFGNQNSIDPYFGLGDAAAAELVRIEWPSGLVEQHRNISANQRVRITERPGIQRLAYTRSNGCRLQITGRPGDTCKIEASTDLQTWTFLTTVTNTTPACQWFDTSATNYPHRFYRAVARE